MSKRSLITASSLVVFVAAALVGITWGAAELTDASIRDAARTVQSLGTLTAIFAGGIFALHKLQVFRDFQPHLTITHEVSHRRVGESYVHLDVTATLRNSSKTHVEVREADYALQLVSPTSDKEIDSLYAEAFGGEYLDHLQWPRLGEGTSVWTEGDLVVEPGESHQETIEFIVKDDVESVLIYTYFYNSGHSEGSQSAEGWHASTVYDIIEERRPHNSDGGAQDAT